MIDAPKLKLKGHPIISSSALYDARKSREGPADPRARVREMGADGRRHLMRGSKLRGRSDSGGGVIQRGQFFVTAAVALVQHEKN